MVYQHCIQGVCPQDKNECPKGPRGVLGLARNHLAQTTTLKWSSQTLNIYNVNVPLPLLLLHRAADY